MKLLSSANSLFFHVTESTFGSEKEKVRMRKHLKNEIKNFFPLVIVDVAKFRGELQKNCANCASSGLIATNTS